MGPCCILKTIKNVKGIRSDLKTVRNLGFKLCGWFNVLSHHQSQDWVKCHLERFINFSVTFQIYRLCGFTECVRLILQFGWISLKKLWIFDFADFPRTGFRTDGLTKLGSLVKLKNVPLWAIFLAVIPGSLLASMIFVDHNAASILIQVILLASPIYFLVSSSRGYYYCF